MWKVILCFSVCSIPLSAVDFSAKILVFALNLVVITLSSIDPIDQELISLGGWRAV